MSRTRNFLDEETSRIQVALGQVANLHRGAVTIAAIIRRNLNEWGSVLSNAPNSSSVYYRGLEIGSSGQPGLGLVTRVGSSYSRLENTGFVIPVNQWCLVAATKAAGTATARFHRYNFSTSTWNRVNTGSSGSDSSQTDQARMYIGHNEFWQESIRGNIAIVGTWLRVLSDGEVDTLIDGVQEWLDVNPSGQGRAVWVLNQESTSDPVEDITGGGADQVGSAVDTSVSTDVPPGFTYLPPDDPFGGSDASLTVTAEGEGYAVVSSGSDSSVDVTTQGGGFPVFSGGSDASVSIEPTAGVPPRIDVTVMIGPTRVGSSEVSDPRSGSIQIGPTRMERRN